MKALAQIEKLTKKHIADIAKLKDKAIKELESIIASLKKQLAHHEAKHAELTKHAKTTASKTAKPAPAPKVAKPRKVAKRKRLSPAQRAKLPKDLSAVIAKNPKGISVGKIVAALSVYPRSSIKKALKDLIKAKAIKMEGTKATAVYKPVK
jgi:hypothetical protein